MQTNFFSQLVIRLTGLEENIEEGMYFSLASSFVGESKDLSALSLPSYLLGEVRHVVTGPQYFEYNENRKKKVLNGYSKYANFYALIKLTASWEEFLLECITVMEMSKTDNYGLENEIKIKELISSEGLKSKSGYELLKALDRKYHLGINQSQEYQIASSGYKLRDCIAHRNGVVAKWDLDKNSKFMKTIRKKAII